MENIKKAASIAKYFSEFMTAVYVGNNETERVKVSLLISELGKQYGFRITANEPEPLGSFDCKRFETAEESVAFFECMGCSVERITENKEIFRVFSLVFQDEGLITYDSDTDEYVFETVQ